MGSSGSSTGSSAPSPISRISSTSSPVRVVAAVVVLKVKVGLLARVVATLVKWQTRSTGGAKRRTASAGLSCKL